MVVDIHRNRARLQAAQNHLRVPVVEHDQRDAVLAAFPVFQFPAFSMNAEAVVRQEVRQSAGTFGHVAVGGDALATHRHGAVADDVGDGVDHVTNRPFGHAGTLTPSKSSALSRITFRVSAALKSGNCGMSAVKLIGSARPSPCGQSEPKSILSTPIVSASNLTSSS